AAATVRMLEFSGSADWADVIEGETDKDLATIRLAGKKVEPKVARKSAEVVARAIMTQPMAALEDHALREIQNLRDQDEAILQRLGGSLMTANPVPADLPRVYAAHMVAAATTSALAHGANIPALFQRMLDLLKAKHDANPIFGPLLVRHPGNITRDRAYIPFRPT